ncbi:MAG: crossover junction endodeoxyribonuclease RuvC [Alphaproteobacteria bacterium]|nr:crossover junction endodeoxyribonuclease RuvC [Alphaproteobacteria bacterium]
MRILGLDPSLSSTGWGVIDIEGSRLKYVADGFIKTNPKQPLEERLAVLYQTLCEVIETYQPNEASIEVIFLNENPMSTIKLAMARGVVVLAPGAYHIPLNEYEPSKVKKALVGTGAALKSQVETMVKVLLSGAKPKNNDSSDALAIAITHAHYRESKTHITGN